MKHRRFFGALLAALLFTAPLNAKSIESFRGQYQAALLLDVDSGKQLVAQDIHRQIYPASVVKMMVALLTLEDVESGRVSWKDTVTVSKWASRIGGSQVYLKQGERFALHELMKAMVISSANDAAVAIAEHLEGSQEDFVKRMNARAGELGMQHTQFQTPHGLPPSRRRKQKADVTTVFDLSLLASELLKHPRYFEWSSTRLDSFRRGTFQLLNTNHRLLRSYPGMDGMKTGYYSKAGFNLVATAKRGDTRLLSIVVGARNAKTRNRIIASLLDSGFEQLQPAQDSKDAAAIRSGTANAVASR
ncbi:MAG: D-alanyl-D-alanine carboxypeptidase family protein [bacterium]|jgi:D-alanyl-D-alanine carboxypeptidase (penicillin-binding protein 5/6)